MRKWIETDERSNQVIRGGGLGWAAATIAIWVVAGAGIVWTSGALIDILHRQGIELSAQDSLTVVAVTGIFGLIAAGVATYVLVRRDAVELGRARARIWTYVILGLLPVVVLVVGFALYHMIVGSGGSSEAGVTILLTSGVIGLLFALAVVAVFFHGLALVDRDEALGLPKGSVRAVIALALILIFAVLSVYLYSTIQADNSPQADIAKQLITTVSTLVVAISSFYFGSSAVQQATATVMATQPNRRLRVLGPATPSIRQRPDGSWTPEALAFTVQADPGAGAINGSVAGDESSTLTNAAGTWTYRPKTPTNPVTLRFAFADDSSSAQEVAVAVQPLDGAGGSAAGGTIGGGGTGGGGTGGGGTGGSVDPGSGGSGGTGAGTDVGTEVGGTTAERIRNRIIDPSLEDLPSLDVGTTPTMGTDVVGSPSVDVSTGAASTDIGDAMDPGLK
ncbi:MAG TPA: hypothetical protein VFI34_02305 [Candidatus Limnocylindrales bacterium]|nr:hypothetical protein [Candidatus Limnocylindrales bacterium]